MNAEELMAIPRHDEGTRLEFKSELPAQGHAIAKEMAAIANGAWKCSAHGCFRRWRAYWYCQCKSLNALAGIAVFKTSIYCPNSCAHVTNQ